MELQKASVKKTPVDLMQEGYEANHEKLKIEQSTINTHNKSTYDLIDEKIAAGNLDGIDSVSLISHGFDQIAKDVAARKAARKEMQKNSVRNTDALNQDFAEKNPEVVDGE